MKVASIDARQLWIGHLWGTAYCAPFFQEGVLDVPG
jgi:hypothetical protein